MKAICRILYDVNSIWELLVLWFLMCFYKKRMNKIESFGASNSEKRASKAGWLKTAVEKLIAFQLAKKKGYKKEKKRKKTMIFISMFLWEIFWN